MYISVIVPIFDELDNIRPLYEGISTALNSFDQACEIIFVNDGSADGSGAVLDDLAAENKTVKVIHFRRNYGQTAAIMAGVGACQGEIIIPMDGDLQNDPTDIPRLVEKLDEGFEVVSGWRKKREDPEIRRFPSRVANRLISNIFNVHIHDYGCTMKAYRRDVIKEVKLYGEMHRYIPIYASWLGAKVTEIPITHHARIHGKSKYGMRRIIRVMLDVFFLYFMDRAFDRPIQFFGKLSVYSLFFGGLTATAAIWMKLAGVRDLVESPLPLLAAALALAGVLFFLLGVLAEIQMRIYFETSGRTPYSIKSSKNLETETINNA